MLKKLAELEKLLTEKTAGPLPISVKKKQQEAKTPEAKRNIGDTYLKLKNKIKNVTKNVVNTLSGGHDEHHSSVNDLKKAFPSNMTGGKKYPPNFRDHGAFNHSLDAVNTSDSAVTNAKNAKDKPFHNVSSAHRYHRSAGMSHANAQKQHTKALDSLKNATPGEETTNARNLHKKFIDLHGQASKHHKNESDWWKSTTQKAAAIARKIATRFATQLKKF